MRLYRKDTTTHPFCIYLSEAEAHELTREVDSALLLNATSSSPWPEHLEDLACRLEDLLADPNRKQA